MAKLSFGVTDTKIIGVAMSYRLKTDKHTGDSTVVFSGVFESGEQKAESLVLPSKLASKLQKVVDKHGQTAFSVEPAGFIVEPVAHDPLVNLR